MKDSARYVKIVEWSDEDQCFVGSCPGLLYGGCHGDDEQAVFAELCEIVNEAIELYKKDGKPLPRRRRPDPTLTGGRTRAEGNGAGATAGAKAAPAPGCGLACDVGRVLQAGRDWLGGPASAVTTGLAAGRHRASACDSGGQDLREVLTLNPVTVC